MRLDRSFALTSFIAELAPSENSPSESPPVTSKLLTLLQDIGRTLRDLSHLVPHSSTCDFAEYLVPE